MATPTRKWLVARRRKCWNDKCQFCGDRWHRSKSNYYIEKSECCMYCMQYIGKVLARGAAWVIKRRSTLRFWDERLASAQGGRKSRVA